MNDLSAANDTPDIAARQSHITISPRTKTAAILRLFIQRGERGLNCFESVRLAHDYVLRSTVRYWLDEKGRKRAAELLGARSPAEV